MLDIKLRNASVAILSPDVPAHSPPPRHGWFRGTMLAPHPSSCLSVASEPPACPEH